VSAKSNRCYSVSRASRSLAIFLTFLLVFPEIQAAAQSACVSTQWTTFNASLQDRTETFNAVVNNGYLYAIGGVKDPTTQGAGTFFNTVQYVKLDSTTGMATNATAGLMNLTTAQLPTAIARDLCGVAYHGYVYVVGGVKPGGTWGATTGDVSRGKIVNGDITSWTTQAGLLNTADPNHPRVQLHGTAIATAGTNAYLYIIGGSYKIDASTPPSNITGEVYYAQISATDGSLSAFTRTTDYPTRIYKTCPVVVNGNIYVAGGEDPDFINAAGGPATDKVYYATLDTSGGSGNGSVLSWTLAATSLPFNSSANPPSDTMASQAVVYVNTKGILMMGGDASGKGNDNSALLEGKSPVGGNINWSIWTSTPPPSPLALPAKVSRNAGATFNHYAYSLGGLVTGHDSSVVNCFLVP
jgi:hypothetical protein